MSRTTTPRTWTRWLPAAVVPVVVVAGAIAIPAAADASPNLPETTAAEVLASISGSSNTAYSGTIQQSSDLGLPELPASATGSSGDQASTALEFLTGSHTARVFTGGSSTQRLQVIDQLAERDVVRNGDDVWMYDSSSKEATHLDLSTLPDHEAPTPTTTPAGLATKLLDAVDPSTVVTVDDTARIAGRPSYQITLTPRSDTTLVGSVTLGVDAETGLPLSVVVSAVGQSDPAFSVAFSSIDFSAPAASTFEFTPPADATVTEKAPEKPASAKPAPTDPATADGAKPTVTGSGWSSIIELPAGEASAFDSAAGSAPDASSDAADTSALLDQLTTPVDGGRVLETSLVSVLLTTDGRVLVGAVSADQLVAAAG